MLGRDNINSIYPGITILSRTIHGHGKFVDYWNAFISLGFSSNWFEGKNLLSVPEFWIVSFLLFFYSCSFLYFVSFSFFYERMDITFYRQLNFLIKILGSAMYLVMGLAFYAPFVFKKSIV